MTSIIKNITKHKIAIIVIIILSIIGVALGQKNYYALIISLFGVYSIIATALDILFGYTGQISLGHAGLFAIGAYSSALLTMRLEIPTFLSLLLGAVISGFIGTLIAIPASKLVKHFLSLLMIAFGQIVYLIAVSWTSLTGGTLGIMNIPYLEIFGFKFDTNFKCAALIWIVLVIVIILKNRIVTSRVGKAFIAIKENTTAARGLGINVQKYKVLAFTISATITGFAGGLYAFLRGFISPETFNGTQSVLFMTMLLFGGIATLLGPVIGASILLLFKEVFQIFAYYQGLIYALFMLLVLFFFPRGLVGLFSQLTNFMKELLKKKLNRGQDHVES